MYVHTYICLYQYINTHLIKYICTYTHGRYIDILYPLVLGKPLCLSILLILLGRSVPESPQQRKVREVGSQLCR